MQHSIASKLEELYKWKETTYGLHKDERKAHLAQESKAILAQLHSLTNSPGALHHHPFPPHHTLTQVAKRTIHHALRNTHHATRNTNATQNAAQYARTPIYMFYFV